VPVSSTSGLVSNIDYKSLIEQLVSIKRKPIDALEADKAKLEDTASAFSTLSSKVTDLRSAADDLRLTDGFKVFTTTSTDETILTASASSSASKGTFELVVSALAKAHKIAADGVASTTTLVASGAGSFKFTVGSGAEQTVSVDATTTLTDLQVAINNLSAGVTASIVDDGSGATGQRLILTSDTTGTTSAVTITQNDTTLNFATTLQAAQDAAFTLDTLSFTRTTNTITDVITGVTIDLKSADAAKTVTLSVDRDTAELEKKIVSFTDKYNSVMSYIKDNNRYDSETGKAGPLFGDTIARTVLDDLRRLMTSEISSLPSTMNRLIHIGVTTDSEGKMLIDSTKLSDALSTDFDAVKNLFVDATLTGGTTNGFGGLLYDKADDLVNLSDGRITLRANGLNDNISNIDLTLSRKEYQLQLYEDGLRSQFTALETLLAGFKQQSGYLTNL